MAAWFCADARAQCGTWRSFSPCTLSDAPFDFAIFNGELIACGELGGGNVKHWTGGAWETFDNGPHNCDGIYALAVYDGELIAGGVLFAGSEEMDGIARWTGSAWQPFGLTTDKGGAVVRHMTVYGGELIVGGHFSGIGGVNSSKIARWNGSGWLALPGFAANDGIEAMTVFHGELVVGGRFAAVDGRNAGNIARWDGREWRPLGEGVTGADARVDCLAVWGDSLVAGGTFTDAGGRPASNIARWDGRDWQPLGEGLNDAAKTLAVHGGELVAGGAFTEAGGRFAHNMARWDGRSWKDLGSGLYGDVTSSIDFNGELVVGGRFSNVPLPSGIDSRVVRWDEFPGSCTGACCLQGECSLSTVELCEAAGGLFHGSGVACDQVVCPGQCQTWQPMGQGIYFDEDGTFSAMAEHNGKVIAAGRFFLNGLSTGWIPMASWDGETWQPMTQGLVPGSRANDVMSVGADLYAASNASTFRLNGASWEPLAAGFSGGSKLGFYHDQLVAVGKFTFDGTDVPLGIARWDGRAWRPLGTGVIDGDGVASLTAYKDQLIAAGGFQGIGGVPANNIAAWDGSAWHALGGGVSGEYASVYEAVVSDGLLAVGGVFTSAGGVPVNNIAAWDGESWSDPFAPAGEDHWDFIVALAVSQGRLVASGGWSDDSFLSRVRRWNPVAKEWESISAPLRGLPYVILATDAGMFAGGGMFSADDPIYYRGPEIEMVAQWPFCTQPCRVDFNGDWTVNVGDLAILLDAWGECANPSRCAADVAPPGGNGLIDADDLFGVLDAWGGCP